MPSRPFSRQHTAATAPAGPWPLALSLRKGEALALKWSDVDLDAGTLVVRRSLQRREARHGCDGSCGGVSRGTARSGRPADWSPSRQSPARAGGASGSRLRWVTLLRAYREERARDRERARELWHDEGWVFAQANGKPIHARSDHNEWKQLLSAAGVRDGRLHDARHTAATVLLVLGVPERAVMGWSHSAMAARYQHFTETVQRDIANRVGGFLWDGK